MNKAKLNTYAPTTRLDFRAAFGDMCPKTAIE